MRGEYAVIYFTSGPGVELPPRARRIPVIPLLSDDDLGTTSACAENTDRWGTIYTQIGNYLRVRGEYSLANP